MKKFAVIIVLMLLTALILLTAAACSTPTTSEGQTNSTQENESAQETETQFFPDIEKQDYDGESFRIIGIRDAGTWVYGEEYGINKGQVLNDVLYEMNTLVEDYLNINIEYEYVEHKAGQSVIYDKVYPTMMSGDDNYQLCILPAYRNVASFVVNDCVKDFYELDNLDFDQPYWNREVIESLEIEDHAYIAMGDICFYEVYPIYCNKDLLAAAGRDVPYDKVRNNEWTLDEFISITSDLYADNGDGVINNQDMFGYASIWNMNGNCFMQASNVYVVKRLENESFELSLYNDRFVDLYDKLINWSKNESVYLWRWGASESTVVNFLDNRTYFTQNVLNTQYQEAEFNFGILPIPKYDVAQEEYAHCNWGDNIVVPKTVKNVEMVGQALELLSYYSRTMVMPKYYDEVLELRVSNAPDDREMVELICNTIVFDPGIAYCDGNQELHNLVYLPANCILDGHETITSYYTKNSRSAERYLMQKIYKG